MNSRKDTKAHIKQVSKFLSKLRYQLIFRGIDHDKSKLFKPEKPIFDEYTEKLKTVTYGSDQYKHYLSHMKVALDHHYSNNRHHPEHHKDGIRGMDLVDIMEMLCDWKAASLRHDDGCIMRSLELNQERFGYSDELKSIMMNTLKYLE